MKNIWVWHAMRSLVSRGHVKHQFSWQWNYYMLTNEGIEVKMELVSFDSVGIISLFLLPSTSAATFICLMTLFPTP